MCNSTNFHGPRAFYRLFHGCCALFSLFSNTITSTWIIQPGFSFSCSRAYTVLGLRFHCRTRGMVLLWWGSGHGAGTRGHAYFASDISRCINGSKYLLVPRDFLKIEIQKPSRDHSEDHGSLWVLQRSTILLGSLWLTLFERSHLSHQIDSIKVCYAAVKPCVPCTPARNALF